MRHCCSFDAIDIWYINDSEKFSERKLSFGICPICNTPIAVLIQFDKQKSSFEIIKKLGVTADKFVKKFVKEKKYSFSSINKEKFNHNTYKWVYGVNKELKNKIRQYAKDFFGNSVIIKDI